MRVLSLFCSQSFDCVMSAGAIAGNPFLVDRQFLAKELGMVGGVCPNSMDAVSDRDFVLEFAFFSSVLMVHLSRCEGDMVPRCRQTCRWSHK